PALTRADSLLSLALSPPPGRTPEVPRDLSAVHDSRSALSLPDPRRPASAGQGRGSLGLRRRFDDDRLRRPQRDNLPPRPTVGAFVGFVLTTLAIAYVKGAVEGSSVLSGVEAPAASAPAPAAPPAEGTGEATSAAPAPAPAEAAPAEGAADEAPAEAGTPVDP